MIDTNLRSGGARAVTISPRDLFRLFEEGHAVDLIDVRTPAEYHTLHAQGARNIPLNRFEPQELAGDRQGSGEELLCLICQSGRRAKEACERFLVDGHSQVAVVEGGTQAWEEEGLPVVRGKKTISLERQVRIVMGSLVLIGLGLGLSVNPLWLVLSAFAGGGLVFAGITDTCGMAMLLAKMPWNQVKNPGRQECATR